jgi:DNA-binding transcriptional LysR family regulator
LADGTLVIAWPYALPSHDAYYLAYPEHAAAVPKVKAFVSWMMEQIEEEHAL